MTAAPLLGIAIPSYKRPEMLARLLASIDADGPISVSDNGGFLDEAFTSAHPGVRFVRQAEVVAPLENWNRAVRAVDAEWIVMPGDDDLYYPGSIALIERSIRANPDADILFFGHHIIDEHDRVVDSWRPASEALSPPAGFERVRRGTPARPPGIVFRKTLHERLGGFCLDFGVTAGDNDFYQRATLVGRAVFVTDVACGYRVWNAGATSLTIASPAWLADIDRWCHRVQAFAAGQSFDVYPDSLRDEIYLDNLRAGVRALKSRGGYWSAWRHVASARYPRRAPLLSQFKLLAQLILPGRA